jgi:hypothetical protein
MPKNLTGGKKAKKMKNASSRPSQEVDMSSKNIIKPDDSGAQYFAIVDNFFGKTANVVYINKDTGVTKATAIIRGAVMKRCKKFATGDVVIICTRDFETDKTKSKVDLVHKYFDSDIKELRKRRDLDSKFLNLLDSYIVATVKGETNIQKAYDDYGNDNVRFSAEDRATFEEDEDEEPFGGRKETENLLKQGNRDMPPSESESESEDE